MTETQFENIFLTLLALAVMCGIFAVLAWIADWLEDRE